MTKKLLWFALASLGLGCGTQQSSDVSDLSGIVGVGKYEALQNSKIPESRSYKELAKAVGKLDGQCTAFHIGQGLVASAGHCFEDGKPAGTPCQSQKVV
ncbi:MAG: hypothetical protein HRU19_06620 [Pseudobacteriovorax sp.]|nr:hypothetical protein [Pseudobacteriovorax sp.]